VLLRPSGVTGTTDPWPSAGDRYSGGVVGRQLAAPQLLTHPQAVTVRDRTQVLAIQLGRRIAQAAGMDELAVSGLRELGFSWAQGRLDPHLAELLSLPQPRFACHVCGMTNWSAHRAATCCTSLGNAGLDADEVDRLVALMTPAHRQEALVAPVRDASALGHHVST